MSDKAQVSTVYFGKCLPRQWLQCRTLETWRQADSFSTLTLEHSPTKTWCFHPTGMSDGFQLGLGLYDLCVQHLLSLGTPLPALSLSKAHPLKKKNKQTQLISPYTHKPSPKRWSSFCHSRGHCLVPWCMATHICVSEGHILFYYFFKVILSTFALIVNFSQAWFVFLELDFKFLDDREDVPTHTRTPPPSCVYRPKGYTTFSQSFKIPSQYKAFPGHPSQRGFP